MLVPPPEIPFHLYLHLAHSTAVEKKFWYPAHLHMLKEGIGDASYSSVLEKLFLISSEVHEAGDEIRKPDTDINAVREEVADIVIRGMDLLTAVCGGDALTAEAVVYTKMQTNLDREPKHGKRF